MTKPIISLAVAIAFEQEKLQFKESLIKYLPEFKNAKVKLNPGSFEPLKRSITIFDLLTHNAGLSYGFNRSCLIGRMYKNDKLINQSKLSLKEFVEKLARYPLDFQPVTKWRYSLATDVLARVLEIVYDKPIEKILAELIFKPLKMTDTAFFVPKEKKFRLMPVYGEPNLDDVTKASSKRKQSSVVDLSDFYPWKKEDYKPRGGHGLFSTINDYSKFCKAIIDDPKQNKNKLI